MVEGPDPELAGVRPFRQMCSQDAVVDHVDERSDAVPAFIIEPDLGEEDGSLSGPQEAAAWASCSRQAHLHVVFGVQTVDKAR